MKKFSLKTISTTILGICLLASCQKEKPDEIIKDKPTDINESAAHAQQILNRTQLVFAMLNSGSISFKHEGISSCAVISTDSSSMPRVTVIDYGRTGCVGNDGITRKGKVIISFDGDYREAGVSVITTFSHYYENDNEITGSDTLQNIGLNGNGNTTLAFSVNYNRILANNEGVEKDVFTGTREWLSGIGTETIDDDQFGSNLTGFITYANGNLDAFTTTELLIYNMTPGCSFFPIKGILTCRRTNYDIIVDYGNGTCDDFASVNDNGSFYTWDLNMQV